MAELLKVLPGWRLEYFYVDYTIGFLLAHARRRCDRGVDGRGGSRFLDRLIAAGSRAKRLSPLRADCSGTSGNIFLLNAIAIAGLAVAFPIASVLAITLGVGIS